MSSFKCEVGESSGEPFEHSDFKPIAQNKANSSAWTQTDAGRRSCRQCRPQGLLRKTKPIPPKRSEGTNILWERSYDEFELSEVSVKQSQFGQKWQVSSFKFEAGEPGFGPFESSDFKLHTSNFKLRRATG